MGINEYKWSSLETCKAALHELYVEKDLSFCYHMSSEVDMKTKNPGMHITLNESDFEVIQLICQKEKINTQTLIRKVMWNWLEKYQDGPLKTNASDDIFDK